MLQCGSFPWAKSWVVVEVSSIFLRVCESLRTHCSAWTISCTKDVESHCHCAEYTYLLLPLSFFFFQRRGGGGSCVQGQLSMRVLSSAVGHDIAPEEQLTGVKLLWTRMQLAQGPTVLHAAVCGCRPSAPLLWCHNDTMMCTVCLRRAFVGVTEQVACGGKSSLWINPHRRDF